MPPRNALSRRRLLRGLIAGAPVGLALPCLDAMLNGRGDALADGTPLPTRFGVWFYGTGAFDRWWPEPIGKITTLPTGFTALQRHLAQVTMVSGLKFESFGDYATNRHYMGASSVLSGAPPKNGRPGGITVDQAVAKLWKGTPRASLEISVTDDAPISFNAADSPNAPTRDPRKLLAGLFGARAPAAGQATLRRAYLDAVKGDIADLDKTLGVADRQRLESYLDGVAELERATASLPACLPPANATAGIDDGNFGREATWMAMNKASSKLLALALSCGMTRVFSYALSGFNSNPWYPANLANNHHELGHQSHPDLPRSVGYVMDRFAETLDALAEVKEGDGTLLDRTGIIVLTEVAWNHHDTDLPIILAGGAGGKLRGGLHVKVKGASTRASYTLARAVGAPLPSFGTSWALADEGKVINEVLV
jgi:hypothetical protein